MGSPSRSSVLTACWPVNEPDPMVVGQIHRLMEASFELRLAGYDEPADLIYRAWIMLLSEQGRRAGAGDAVQASR